LVIDEGSIDLITVRNSNSGIEALGLSEMFDFSLSEMSLFLFKNEGGYFITNNTELWDGTLGERREFSHVESTHRWSNTWAKLWNVTSCKS